jgi:hypothetical protein
MSVGSMIQVKTRTAGRDGGWHMGQKHEALIHQRLFYVFVDFEPIVPTCHVVPSATVAKAVRDSHQAWLITPGAHGRAHRDNLMRRIMPRFQPAPASFPDGWLDEYRERWDLLNEEPD